MKNLIAVANIIQGAGIATIGEDLFVATIPADVRRGVMLRNPLTGIEMDDGHEDFFMTEFQVIVRDPKPVDGHNRAMDILQALKANNNIQVGDVFISWMIPCHLPVQYPRGDADDIETSFDVRMGFAITS